MQKLQWFSRAAGHSEKVCREPAKVAGQLVMNPLFPDLRFGLLAYNFQRHAVPPQASPHMIPHRGSRCNGPWPPLKQGYPSLTEAYVSISEQQKAAFASLCAAWTSGANP